MKVFVFGSNLAGRHGKGAALTAKLYWGAVLGYGDGFMNKGTDRLDRGCYAIPTKSWDLKTLPLDTIRKYVDLFIKFAKTWPQWTFLVTRVGCGLAGYTDADIAPMFAGAPDNCEFDPAWMPWGLKTWKEKP